MSSQEQKKWEASLERVLGPLDESRGTEPEDGALTRSLDALRDHAGLDAEQRETAWQNILERRESNPPMGAPDMAEISSGKRHGGQDGNVSIFQRPVLMLTAVAASLFLAFGIYNIYQRGSGKGLPGTIVATSGTVRINDRVARKGDVVRFGDRILAGAKSSYVLVVNGKNAIRGLPGSELIYRIIPGKARLEMKAGFLAAVLRNRRGMGNLRIVTPQLDVEVRGTTFFMGLKSKSRTYFCICNGKVHLLPRSTVGGAKPGTVEAAHHAAAHYTAHKNPSGGPGIVKKSSGDMFGHTDPMLEKLAAYIGEKIDWSHVEKHVSHRH